MPNYIHFILVIGNFRGFGRPQVAPTNTPNRYCFGNVGAHGNSAGIGKVTQLVNIDQKRNTTLAKEKDNQTYCHTSLQSPSKNVGAMLRGFKSSVTTKINILRNAPQCPVWQSKYYDHIIRNEQEYQKIWEYINTNPLKWQEDKCFT